MATSKNSSSSGAEQRSDTGTIAIHGKVRISRRKLSLVTITILLNVLLWSSIICLAASVYQIASDPNDATSITPVVLTSTSAVATISYTIIHTVFSLKQSTWEHRQQRVSAAKKSSYVAIRLVVLLCVLWLLTFGWDMILVARTPICLSKASGLNRWQYGSTCHISRVAMVFAAIALTASFILFGLFGVINRPFESHLFKNFYEQPADSFPTSYRARHVSFDSEKSVYRRENSGSTHRRNSSGLSNTGSNTKRLSSIIYAPSPVRSLGLNIFTSDYAPPPIPAAYRFPPDLSQLETPPPMFHPTRSRPPLTHPHWVSGDVITPGFARYSTLAEHSASSWRAVHPPGSSSPLLRASSRSHPHLSAGVAYNNRYSRSSISLTRPQRLSYATPAGSSSSRSNSTGPEGRNSSSTDGKAASHEVACAILHKTHTSSTTHSKRRQIGDSRTGSAPTPDADTTSGAQQPPQPERKATKWRPSLEILYASPNQGLEKDAQLGLDGSLVKPLKLVHSASPDFLSRFSPDTSFDDDPKSPNEELEREFGVRFIVPRKPLPIAKSKSGGHLRQASAPSTVAEAAAVMVKNMPQDLTTKKLRASSVDVRTGERGWIFEEVKNKPLPRIAIL